MFSTFKLHSKTIPFYPLFDSPLSLEFLCEGGTSFLNYSSFINDHKNQDIFRREASCLKFGDSKTVRITSFDCENGALKVGYMLSNYSIYKGFSKIKSSVVPDEGFNEGKVGDRCLSNHCGTGLFIECRRGGSHNPEERVLIGMRPNSEVIDTHRLFRTYSASGSVDFADANPFETIRRETIEELNYNLDLGNTELLSFGYDSQLGYFQFSFFHQSSLDFEELINLASQARDSFEYISLDAITYSESKLEKAIEEIAKLPWEPSALYTLVLLYARVVPPQKSMWFRKELENKIIEYNNDKNFKIFN